VTSLPGQLEGFRIAHLTDLHLGYYVHLEDLEKAVAKIKAQKPDLALITGDISDDLDILPDALKIINSLAPQYGIYASVGNHEYYRGIAEVMRIFQSAPFPMLINQRINLDISGAKITLGGADDPRTLRRDYAEFLENTIEHTLGDVPGDSFKLLMCHRPEGFNYSASKGINLVLSGHTHGGQIGFAGRSLFEPIFPEKYFWGTYRRGKTTLYTSSGMGHWLPFRLGVPAEAPILVLENG
jgi:predicted MPP superfamily phosphohydrolase